VTPPGRIACGRTAGHGARYFLSHDALDPFPFVDGAFDVAYSEHFIEHVPPAAAVRWLREIRRLLRPGGFARLSTPDLRRYVAGYLDPDGPFFAGRMRARSETGGIRESGLPDTPAFMMNRIFMSYGHQWVWDLDELRAAAVEAGFDAGAVTECSFQEGRAPAVARMDRPERADESLYVEIART
jgi:predicted SAM-dependent methyltransferase